MRGTFVLGTLQPSKQDEFNYELFETIGSFLLSASAGNRGSCLIQRLEIDQ